MVPTHSNNHSNNHRVSQPVFGNLFSSSVSYWPVLVYFTNLFSNLSHGNTVPISLTTLYHTVEKTNTARTKASSF
jgi:hypothetical protein